jgi:hypothetical protein
MRIAVLLCTCLLVVLAAADVRAEEGAFSSRMYVSSTWMFDARIGLEEPLTGRLAAQWDMGFSIMGMATCNLFAVFHILDPASALNLALMVGVPNAGFVLSFDGAMVSLGGAVRLGWWITESFCLYLRVGAGYPFFFEEGKDVIRDTHMTVWPDAVIGFAVPL